jgi:hypothetical protein
MEAGAAPITVTDGIDALRGTLPLLELPDQSNRLYEFVVRAAEADPGPRAAACWTEFKSGRVIACGAGNAPSAATIWAHGTIDDWLAAVIDRRAALLNWPASGAWATRSFASCTPGSTVADQSSVQGFACGFRVFSGHLRNRDS